jgi:hypothetical protein
MEMEDLLSKESNGFTQTNESPKSGCENKEGLYFAGMGCNKADPTLIDWGELFRGFRND